MCMCDFLNMYISAKPVKVIIEVMFLLGTVVSSAVALIETNLIWPDFLATGSFFKDQQTNI